MNQVDIAYSDLTQAGEDEFVVAASPATGSAQDDLRAEVERLRQRHPATPRRNGNAPPMPPSLLCRLEAATSRIRRLEADNQWLRDALAHTLGEHRADSVPGRRNRMAPREVRAGRWWGDSQPVRPGGT